MSSRITKLILGLALAAAPFLAAAFASWVEVLALGALATILGVIFGSIDLMNPDAGTEDRMLIIVINVGGVIFATGIAAAVGVIRQRQTVRYWELSRLASVAQGAVLRPLGPQIGSLSVAARYISASAAADCSANGPWSRANACSGTIEFGRSGQLISIIGTSNRSSIVTCWLRRTCK